MTPYPEYKATNLPWLPQIPAHWETRRAKALFRLVTEPAPENNTEELLSVYTHIGVRPRKDLEAKGNRASTTDGYWYVKKGDIICNKLLAWMGAIGVSEFEGVTSPAYDIFRKRTENIYPQYYHYLFRTPLFHSMFRAYSRGIMDMRLRLYYDQFGTIIIPYPNQAEQKQIVRYLDSMTAKINKLIRAKKKQIALLQEQKQAIINQAVSKDLNPNAEMKDSGIDWLGQIPAHWDVKPLKRVCKVNASVSHLLREFSDDSLVTFLPMEAISVDGKIDCSQKQPLKNVKSGFSSFAVNDVVVAKITPCFENGKGACLDALDTAIGYGTTELIVLRGFKNEINQQFLYQVTKITSFRKNGAEVMTGSAGQKRVPANFIANFTCGIPPLEEQNAIVQYLAKQNALFEKTLNGIKKEIEVILEYKNSLIASVVTGQVDVRNIQVEDFDPADLISETDDNPAEDDDQLQEESEVE